MSHYKTFNHDLAFGKGEEAKFSYTLLSGGIEHKADRKAISTKNFCLEYQQPDKFGKPVPSGINITTAEYWVIELVGMDRWVIITTKKLREFFNSKKYRDVFIDGDVLKRGILIPLRDLVEKP